MVYNQLSNSKSSDITNLISANCLLCLKLSQDFTPNMLAINVFNLFLYKDARTSSLCYSQIPFNRNGQLSNKHLA